MAAFDRLDSNQNRSMRQILFPIVLFVAACAQTPSTPPVQAAAVPASGAAPAASGTEVVAKQNCHRENKVGTNMFQTVCEQSDLDRQKGLDTIGRLTGPQAAGGGFSTGR